MLVAMSNIGLFHVTSQRRILDDYPDIGVQHIALQYLAECEALVEAEASEAGPKAGQRPPDGL